MMETILLCKENGIATITLNRPEVRNATNELMQKEICQALQDCDADNNIRVIIITGAGQSFSAGGDVKGMRETIEESPSANEFAERYHSSFIATLTTIRKVRKPIIAKINGAAVGAGTNLALACDIRIASSFSKFGEVFVKRGLMPDWGGTYTLPRIVGMSKACELCFTGRIIDAKTALEIGLVDYVVEPEELDKKVNDLAWEICEAAPLAVRMTKEFLYGAEDKDFASALKAEAFGQSICKTSDDHREGVFSFLEKRPAVFKGK